MAFTVRKVFGYTYLPKVSGGEGKKKKKKKTKYKYLMKSLFGGWWDRIHWTTSLAHQETFLNLFWSEKTNFPVDVYSHFFIKPPTGFSSICLAEHWNKS